jgi:hypothetical protein
MGRDNNTFEKMQRERLKRQKAEDKRVRRQKKKERGATPASAGDGHAPPSEDSYEG